MSNPETRLREAAGTAITLVCLFVYVDMASNGELRRMLGRARARLAEKWAGPPPIVEPSPADITALHREAADILKGASDG